MKRVLALLIAALLIFAAIPAFAEDACKKCGDVNWDTYMYDLHLPTCTTDGYYKLMCNTCGHKQKFMTDEAFGHTLGDWPEGHVDNTCTEMGYALYRCEECYELVKIYTEDSRVLGHDWGKWNVTVQPTEHSAGTRTRTCKRCGQATTETFYPDGTLYRGMKNNSSVTAMQQKLIEMGILNDKADGAFGKKTEQAVKDFQKTAGLVTDGIAWPQTLEALEKAYQSFVAAKVTPVPTPVVTPAPEPTPETEMPECCGYAVGAYGVEEIVYCAEHKALFDDCEAILSAAKTDEEMLAALKHVRVLWTDELDRLFEKCMEDADDEGKKSIVSTKSSFSMYLASRESAWQKQYTSDPAMVERQAVNMIIAQCVDMCAMVGGEENEAEMRHGYLNVTEENDGQFTVRIWEVVTLLAWDDPELLAKYGLKAEDFIGDSITVQLSQPAIYLTADKSTTALKVVNYDDSVIAVDADWQTFIDNAKEKSQWHDGLGMLVSFEDKDGTAIRLYECYEE